MNIPDQLREIASQVEAGKQPKETVRTLVRWFGYDRRGVWVRSAIEQALVELNIATQPDFSSVWIDVTVTFVSRQPTIPQDKEFNTTDAGTPETFIDLVTNDGVNGNSEPVSFDMDDPTHRISILPSANLAESGKSLVSVKPDSTLTEAITLMLINDFSQLPVMQTPHSLKGVVSWQGIAQRRVCGIISEKVSDYLEEPVVVSHTASLLSVVQQIAHSGFVFVSGSDRRITGVVTTTDISVQFQQLAEPFLLIGEIENQLRKFISEGNFTVEELKTFKNNVDDTREIKSVADFTFGEYVRILENEKCWNKIPIPLDRVVFRSSVDRAKNLRNDVMHFDPDPLKEEDLAFLRQFASMLRSLRIISPS